MSGNIAINEQTGEILVLSPDGAWQPARRAENPQTGQKLYFDGTGWQEVPKPKQSGPEPSFMRGVGIGVRDAAQGLLTLPGMAYDAVGGGLNLLSSGVEAIGGPSLPRIRTARENIDAAADAAGLPKAETGREKMLSSINQNVAATLPTMGAGVAMQGANMAPQAAQMLAGNISSQLAGAAGAGAAGEWAAQQGWHPLMQAGAGLAGGVAGAAGMQALQAGGRVAASMIQPFSESGRERIAADVLLRGSADPEGLQARLAQGLADDGRRLPGAPVTTAQATRDPGLMLLESGMRSQMAPNTPTGMSPAVAIRDVEAQRNAARLAAIQALQDGSDPATRGAAVRGALNASEDAMGARTDLAFSVARDRNPNRYPVNSVIERAREATRMFDPSQGGEGVPAALQSVMDDIATLGRVDLNQAQNLRSRLGKIAGEASRAGDNRTASAAGAISQALEGTIDDPRWLAAVAQRREQGMALGRDASGNAMAGSILRTDRFGAPMLPDEQVAARAIRSPEGVKQVLGAYYKALDDGRQARLPADQIEALSESVKAARGALRGQFMDDLFNAAATTGDLVDAAGNPSRFLSPAQFKRFFDQNAAVAREIFEPGQYLQLRRLAADFAESSAATRTVNAAGSNTAQNLSVGNLIARSTNGLIDANSPLAQTLGSAGGVMRFVYAAPEAATREILTRAMVDPKFAQQLLSRATPRSVDQAMRYMEANMLDRLREARDNALGRSLIRTGIEATVSP